MASDPSRQASGPPDTGASIHPIFKSSFKRFAISFVEATIVVEKSISKLPEFVLWLIPLGPKITSSTASVEVTHNITISL